mmetsp:Transcript_66618/g.105877  ORF Transcript_66618/g.105877 Transcript_66618/m.105877 type:complete len:149 (+) Transcript_66618:52-498(+)
MNNEHFETNARQAAPPQYQQPPPQQQAQVVAQQPPQQQQVVVVQRPVQQQQVVVVPQTQQGYAQPVRQNSNHLPRVPMNAFCPRCQQNIVTKVTLEPGLGTYAVAGGICITGFFCGCCLIPFCVDQLQDAVHACPTCSTIIGYNKIIS